MNAALFPRVMILVSLGVGFLFSACSQEPDDSVVQQAKLAKERAQLAADRAAAQADRAEAEAARAEAEWLRDESDLRKAIAGYAAEVGGDDPGPVEVGAGGDADSAAVAESPADTDSGSEAPLAENDFSKVPFYEDLKEDGSWYESEDYGYVWEPSVVSSEPDWMPYTDGGWYYTDYGWTWDAAQPWGEITGHYGRWACLNANRWVWVPGIEWAPAWVSWREDDDCIGWAPLPPDCRWRRSVGIRGWVDSTCRLGPGAYCFVERRNFCAPNARHVRRPRNECVRRYASSRNTTCLVDAGSYRVRNEGGPGRDEFRRSGQLRERRVEFVDAGRARQRGADRSDGKLAAVRVTPVRRKNDERPAQVRGKLAAGPLERGWSEVRDRTERRELQRRVATEAVGAFERLPEDRRRVAESERVRRGTSDIGTGMPLERRRAARGQTGSGVVGREPSVPGANARPAVAADRSTDRPRTPTDRRTAPDSVAASDPARQAAASRRQVDQEAIRRQQASATPAFDANRERRRVTEQESRPTPGGPRPAVQANRPEVDRNRREPANQPSEQARVQRERVDLEQAQRDTQRRQQEEGNRRQAAEVQRRQQEEGNRRQAAEVQRRQQEEGNRRQAAEVQRRQQEENNRRQAAEVQRRQQEENNRRQAAEGQRRQQEENNRRQAAEGQRRQQEENYRRQAAEVHQRQQEENNRRQAAEGQRRQQEESNRRQAVAEAQHRQQEDNNRRQAEENNRRAAEENQRRQSESRSRSSGGDDDSNRRSGRR